MKNIIKYEIAAAAKMASVLACMSGDDDVVGAAPLPGEEARERLGQGWFHGDEAEVHRQRGEFEAAHAHCELARELFRGLAIERPACLVRAKEVLGLRNSLVSYYTDIAYTQPRAREWLEPVESAVQSCNGMLAALATEIINAPALMRSMRHLGAAALVCYALTHARNDGACRRYFVREAKRLVDGKAIEPELWLIGQLCGPLEPFPGTAPRKPPAWMRGGGGSV